MSTHTIIVLAAAGLGVYLGYTYAQTLLPYPPYSLIASYMAS